jgi:hypothetical protein
MMNVILQLDVYLPTTAAVMETPVPMILVMKRLDVFTRSTTVMMVTNVPVIYVTQLPGAIMKISFVMTIHA